MPRPGPIARKLIEAAEHLRDEVDRLRFGDPVTHAYNPLDYAWDAHRAYLEKNGGSEKRVVFLQDRDNLGLGKSAFLHWSGLCSPGPNLSI